MGYRLVPVICLNPRMQPSYLALIARFVMIYQWFWCGLIARGAIGMRQTTVVCGLGVSAEVL